MGDGCRSDSEFEWKFAFEDVVVLLALPIEETPTCTEIEGVEFQHHNPPLLPTLSLSLHQSEIDDVVHRWLEREEVAYAVPEPQDLFSQALALLNESWEVALRVVLGYGCHRIVVYKASEFIAKWDMHPRSHYDVIGELSSDWVSERAGRVRCHLLGEFKVIA